MFLLFWKDFPKTILPGNFIGEFLKNVIIRHGKKLFLFGQLVIFLSGFLSVKFLTKILHKVKNQYYKTIKKLRLKGSRSTLTMMNSNGMILAYQPIRS